MATAKKSKKATTRKKTASRKTTARKTSGKTSGSKTGGAGKSAAAKPAKAPARKAKKSPKARLEEVFERAERTFGPVHPPETSSVLEKAVYLILREKGTDQTTQRSLKSLREDFVDWNEVRVSRPTELARLMSGSTKSTTIRRYEVRARRVGEMIDQIYNDRNEPSLEFILEERPKGQFEYLEDLDDLGIHNAYALVQWLAGDTSKFVVLSSEMAKVCEKLGITDSGAISKVKKDLLALVPGDQLIAAQAHLNQLGQLEADDWPASFKELLD